MSKRYLSNNDMRNAVHSILRQMAADNWKPDYVVGITRGGLMPALFISNYLNIPMETLKISLRDHKGHGDGKESNLWMAEDAYGYGGEFDGNAVIDEYQQKNILVIDDINDSGATLNWLVADWESGCFPGNARWDQVWNNNVRFAAIVDNLSSGFTKKINYSGVEINKAEKDEWIVFPYDQWWEQ